MADKDSSPGGFRRERNLSNRNFKKHGSNRRRVSTESHSSAESKSLNNSPTKYGNTTADEKHDDLPLFTFDSTDSTESYDFNSQSLSSERIPLVGTTVHDTLLAKSDQPTLYLDSSDLSIHFDDSEGQSTLHGRSELKTEFNDEIDLEQQRHSAGISQAALKQLQQQESTSSPQSSSSPQTPDPALLDVKQKLLMFENLKHEQPSTSKCKSISTQSLLESERASSSSPLLPSSSNPSVLLFHAYPAIGSNKVTALGEKKNRSIEEHSEDEVDSLQEEINENYVQQIREEQDQFGKTTSPVDAEAMEEDAPADAINEAVLMSQNSAKALSPDKVKSPLEETVGMDTTTGTTAIPTQKTRNKDFPRNFRSRPRTEVLEATSEPSLSEPNKYHSLHSKQNSAEPDEDEQIVLRDKGFSFVQPILEELIKTEETYVKNLWIGIKNYGKIFERKDLRPGLRGKKYVLFGNIEQIAEFHRDEFLPMLQRNKHDLKRIFDEFQRYIDNNYFYGYVLFTMNKQRSLELCETYKNYFKLLQSEIDDKLGINSFLVQPIQRMARYPLLLQQFINTLFKKHREYEMKPTIESCCRLEKKLRNFLITTNESESINDIVGIGDANEFNTFYQGKFRKVSEFHCFDHTLKRGYRSKVFIFDKCIIYTEIKGKQLIFHGRYPYEHIGIVAKPKHFTLFYEQRKQQECDFTADPPLIEQWLELITDMIKSYAEEERRKLKELHSREFGGDHMHRKPANLSLFRDSNRFSTDSGIGNMWIVPKPEQDEAVSNRTTWYALT